jgi:benzoate transport
MDVLVISYTAPVIASSWDISFKALGVVFSSGVFGMAVGALLLAPYADKIGRKKIILLSTIIISIGILLTGFSKNIYHLILLRFLSGIGIGTMLASTVSLVSEYTPNRSRDFWVSFILAGYPLGAILAGYLSNYILKYYSWEDVYIAFGLISIFFIPIIYFFLLESVDFLLKNQPKNALSRVNLILKKLDFSKIEFLPTKINVGSKIPVNSLFQAKYIDSTIKLWTAFFFSFACLYFLISWIPKIVTELGLSLELGIYSGTVFNIGAFFGIVTQGYFSSKFGLKKIISLFLIVTCIIMTQIQHFFGSDWMLFIFSVLGFTIQGGFVGLYSIAARIYPTEFRTTGVGWGIGAGRLGAVLGPLVAGVLIGAGISVSMNFIIFAVAALIAALITHMISTSD